MALTNHLLKFGQSDLENWANKTGAKQGDILFILSGDEQGRTQLAL